MKSMLGDGSVRGQGRRTGSGAAGPGASGMAPPALPEKEGLVAGGRAFMLGVVEQLRWAPSGGTN